MSETDVINDYKNTVKRLQQECTEKTDAIIVLGEQLQRYKQAIKEIEKISKEAGNTEYLTFPDFNLKQNAKMLIGQFNGYLEQIIQKCEEVNNEH